MIASQNPASKSQSLTRGQHLTAQHRRTQATGGLLATAELLVREHAMQSEWSELFAAAVAAAVVVVVAAAAADAAADTDVAF